MKNTKLVTVNTLSRESGSAPRSIVKWLDAEAVKVHQKANRRLYEFDEAMAAIEKYRKESAASVEESPFRRKALAEAMRTERENRIAERIESREYIKRDEIEKVITIGISKIELVPSKFSSRFGCTDEMTKYLTQLLDEARHEWCKEIMAIKEETK